MATNVTTPRGDRDAIRVPHSTSYVYLISFIAALGGFLFGYDLAVISGASIFLKKAFNLSGAAEGFMMSSALFGCLIGPFIAGFLSDRFGRKAVLMLAGILFTIAAIGTALPKTIDQFNFFRILAGLGIGLASVVSPMYIAEVAPARIRGRLVNLNQLSIGIGALTSFIVAYNLSDSGNWRMMFFLAIVPTILMLVGLIFVPQSPRWLAQKGRFREASDVIGRISGQEAAEREIGMIKSTLSAETGSFWELFSPGVRIALLIGAGLCFFQAWSGATAINYYTPTILQKAGFTDPSTAILTTLIMNIISLICCIFTIMYVDRFGRRPFLLWGTAGMALFLILIGVCFRMNLTGLYIVGAIYLFNITYQISLAPMAWLVLSEIFPTRIRAHGQSAGTFIVWISTLASTFGFAPVRDSFEDKFGSPAGLFYIFGAVCIAAFLFTWRVVPETKGKTLEEIGQMWLRKRVS